MLQRWYKASWLKQYPTQLNREIILANHSNNMAYESRKKGVLSLQNNATVHSYFFPSIYMVIKEEVQSSASSTMKENNTTISKPNKGKAGDNSLQETPDVDMKWLLKFYFPFEVGEEHSHTNSVSTSRRWKFRWQPQAAQVSALLVPSSPLAMNSLHPSTAYPPTPAAWFFWHSPYLTLLTVKDELAELLDGSSLLSTTWRFLILQDPKSTLPSSPHPPRKQLQFSNSSRDPESEAGIEEKERNRERKMGEEGKWQTSSEFVPANPNPRMLIYSL